MVAEYRAIDLTQVTLGVGTELGGSSAIGWLNAFENYSVGERGFDAVKRGTQVPRPMQTSGRDFPSAPPYSSPLAARGFGFRRPAFFFGGSGARRGGEPRGPSALRLAAASPFQFVGIFLPAAFRHRAAAGRKLMKRFRAIQLGGQELRFRVTRGGIALAGYLNVLAVGFQSHAGIRGEESNCGRTTHEQCFGGFDAEADGDGAQVVRKP